MPGHQNFLTPKLTGKRFEDHSIPLELLEDFAAFEDLIIEMAKTIYLEKNKSRQRVPRGFAESVSLKLTGIDEGSAIPIIALIYALTTSTTAPALELFPEANYSYFEEARDRIFLGIDAAQTGRKITDYIPEDLLGYFNRIGKRLKEDEVINFNPSSELNAKLDKSSRKKLVLASSSIRQVTEETTIIALVPEADKSKSTFTLLLEGTQRISAEIPPAHFATVIKAFNEYENKCYVQIKGIGRFNKQDNLESFESIEQISIMDPLDIRLRLDDFSSLEDGWFEGDGIAPKIDGLNWFASSFEGNYDSHLPLPYLYPMLNGGIQAEWSMGRYEISLSVDLATKKSFYHALDMANDEVDEIDLLLSEAENWRILNQKLNEIVQLTNG